MTELNPPGFLQNAGNTHTAQETRITTSALLGHWGLSTGEAFPRSSKPYTGGLRVSAHTPNNMTVDVSRGLAFVRGSENTTQGMYTCYNDATVNLAIGASDPSNPRKDIVVARVRDSFYSGGTNAWALEVVAGTPGASPVEPTAPANSCLIAVVTVPAAATTIVTGNINNNPSATVAGWTAAMGAFELVSDKSLYDFMGAPLWVANLSDEFWFQDFSSTNWHIFFTSKNAGKGINEGTVYSGTSSLYSGTAEAVVTSMSTPTFTATDPAGFSGKFVGHVRCRVQSTVAADRAKFRVRLDSVSGTVISTHNVYIPQSATDTPVDFKYYYPGDGASHTIVLTCARDAGTGTVSITGGGTTDRFFHLLEQEKMGNVSGA